MENGQNVGASTMDASLMKVLDPRKQGSSINDIMTRRLKNRERQRRYRARKRLEADMRKASSVSQSMPVEEEVQLNSSSEDSMTRIHCQRDWKKDARRAHLFKEQEMKSNGPLVADQNLVGGSRAPSEAKAEAQLNGGFSSCWSNPISDSSEAQRVVLSRRHWKAEARNKKS